MAKLVVCPFRELFRVIVPVRSIRLSLVLTFLFFFCVAAWHCPASAGPLHDAAYTGDYLAAKRLIDAGANVNEIGRPAKWSDWMKSYPPLFFAVSYNHKDVVKLLIQMGADATFVSDGGKTLLHCAAAPNTDPAWGSWEVGALLLAGGADPNSATDKGETPLHVGARNKESDKWVPLLVEHGAKVNVVDSTGLTPILVAVMSRHMKAAQYLATRGALINNDLPGGVPLDVRVLVDGLHTNSALIRGNAAQTLGDIGPRARPAIPYLEKLLGDQTTLVRGRFFGEPGEKITLGTLAREAIGKILQRSPDQTGTGSPRGRK